MSAPYFVPTAPDQQVRSYASPPWRSSVWYTDRPAEVPWVQPLGEQLGVPGPDQGYALKLAKRFHGRLVLVDGESEADALAGGAAVAMKRAALLGRAPIIHDLTVGLTVWGFLDAPPAPDLVELRRELFEEAHHSVHYAQRRRIADSVPEDLLRQPHEQILGRHRADWRSCIDLVD